MENEKKIICPRCGREIDIFTAYSGNLCLPCYEREYEGMSDEQKKPKFSKNLINI